MLEPQEPTRMRCMEVWGGNVQTQTQLQTSGLDVWISSRPAGQSEAGGDVYYVSSCASGRITRLLLADVSGHGERVTDSARRLRDLMRQHVNTIRQRPLVAAINRHFSETQEAGRFATALVSSFFAPTSSLSLCNAGHPFPLIFRAASQEWCVLDTSATLPKGSSARAANLPLGVVPETVYSAYTTQLAAGDMVLCYTDAFSEARGPDGEILGVDGLLSVVSSLPMPDETGFLSSLTQSLRTLDASNLATDDTSLLLFKANNLRSSTRDNLLAPFRLLGPVADHSQVL